MNAVSINALPLVGTIVLLDALENDGLAFVLGLGLEELAASEPTLIKDVIVGRAVPWLKE
jgi:hypothetical protein